MTAIRYAEHWWFQSVEGASGMPFDHYGVEKLDGYLLRGLSALRAAILALGREARLYGIHPGATFEFEVCGQRLRDRRIGGEPQKAGKQGSG